MKFDRVKLKTQIEESGLRIDHICKKAKIHRSYLWMILTGVRKPSLDVVNRILGVLS